MPTYDYRCDTCGSQFEFVQSFSEDALTRCPGKRRGGPVTEQCTSPGKGKVKKVFSKVGIAFKGEGFYKNDHGSKAPASTDTASGDTASGDKTSGDKAPSSPASTETSSSTSTTASSSTDKSSSKATTASD